MYPPLQSPAIPQDTRTCSAKFKSTPGVLEKIRMADSRAAAVAKAQQLPQDPWFRTGVTKFPPWFLQSSADGRVTAEELDRGSNSCFSEKKGSFRPRRFCLSSKSSKEIEVSPATHPAPLASIARSVSARSLPKAKEEGTRSRHRKRLKIQRVGRFPKEIKQTKT